MMVMCNDIVVLIVEYDRRRLGLPNAPLDMENENNRDHRAIYEQPYSHSSKHTASNKAHPYSGPPLFCTTQPLMNIRLRINALNVLTYSRTL